LGWAKFDDQFYRHPKVKTAGPWAELLAVRAVIYAAGLETDGFVPFGALGEIGQGIPAAKRRAATLVSVGLWEDTDGGWLIHDFLDYHPSKAQREVVRADARERMREVRANKTGSSRNPDPDPEPHKASASNAFTAFNAARAVDAVRKRQKDGLPVKSPGGLARTIAADPDHVAESQRLWAHRECANCKGSGFTETYAPGAGQVRLSCREVT
jgi:hypothetical protein